MDKALEDSAGDRDRDFLLESLIDNYGERVKKLAYTYVKDWAAAEDIVQEVFISVYKNLHLFRGEASYKTWIYKITINKSKDTLRSRYFRPDKLIKKLKQNMVHTEPSAEQTMLEENEDSRLGENVMQLPPKYREVIILYYYEELKMEEIQAFTKVNLSTIKTRLRRAKALLKDMYEGGTENG